MCVLIIKQFLAFETEEDIVSIDLTDRYSAYENNWVEEQVSNEDLLEVDKKLRRVEGNENVRECQGYAELELRKSSLQAVWWVRS